MKKIFYCIGLFTNLFLMHAIANAQVVLSETHNNVNCLGGSNGSINLTVDNPALTIDGNIVEANWSAALATSAGGPAPGFGSGHEINAFYMNASTTNLYMALAGNVQDNNRILLFIDNKAGGYNNGSFNRSGAPIGLQGGQFNSGITFDTGFNPDYCLTIGTNAAHNNYYWDLFPLTAGGGGTQFLGDNSALGLEGNPGNGTNTLGFEMEIPWSVLGGTATSNMQVMAMYQSDGGFLSNQFLTKAGSADGNYGNNPVNFVSATPNALGFTPLQYAWSNGATTEDISTLTAGSYLVTVTNGNGQTANTSVNIAAGATVILNTSSTANAICAGNPIALNASGADNYFWNPGALSGNNVTGATANPSVTTTYTVTGSTTAGCTGQKTVLVTVNNASPASTVNINSCGAYTLPNSFIITTSGTYLQTYTNISNCDSIVTYIATINAATTGTSSATATGSYTLPWGPTVTTSGSYSHVYVGGSTAGCDSTSIVNVTIIAVVNVVEVSVKAFLAGPFIAASGMMHDSLRVKGLIPTTEPYTTLNTTLNPYQPRFIPISGSGGESVSATTLATSGTNAIVDWVFIELRSALNASTVVGTRSALIQRDGDIVSAVDGVSPVSINVAPGNYYIAVRHRNHAGIITANTFALNNSTTSVNFTTGSTPIYLNATNNNASPLTGATKNIGTVRAMYPGNCNISNNANAKTISYNNTIASDRTALFNNTSSGASVVNAYTIFDLDMNGSASYNGLVPDRLVITKALQNILTLKIYEQLP